MHREFSNHSKSTLRPNPSHDEIARQAFAIFQERGCPHGQDLEHWLEAESRLRAIMTRRSQPQEPANPRAASKPVLRRQSVARA